MRRSDFVSCNQAFIDCRTPGSDRKENYAMIGPGVSQAADQHVNLRLPHGYNIGAAAMPHGITNNLHLHYTAEVFICTEGEYLLRWGADGTEGELTLRAGDIASIPTWIFRGFTNTGPDDGWLFTVLGMDDTGGIIWGPSVLREAREHGLYLTADNKLIDTVAGDTVPPQDELISPWPRNTSTGCATTPPRRWHAGSPPRTIWCSPSTLPRHHPARRRRPAELRHRLRHDRGPASGAPRVQSARAQPRLAPRRPRTGRLGAPSARDPDPDREGRPVGGHPQPHRPRLGAPRPRDMLSVPRTPGAPYAMSATSGATSSWSTPVTDESAWNGTRRCARARRTRAWASTTTGTSPRTRCCPPARPW
ncbi:cupin domain-containing protein [Streptomyces sp. M19]